QRNHRRPPDASCQHRVRDVTHHIMALQRGQSLAVFLAIKDRRQVSNAYLEGFRAGGLPSCRHQPCPLVPDIRLVKIRTVFTLPKIPPQKNFHSIRPALTTITNQTPSSLLSSPDRR